MKKFSPYLFPLLAMIVVVFLLYRWYSLRTQEVDRPLEFGEGVEIENLSESELSGVLGGADDVKTVQLEPLANDDEEAEDPSTGIIRYEVNEDKTLFSVMASLPELAQGAYQVWLKEVGGTGMRKAFSLVMGKGGMTGSASVSSELLPFEVVVSKEVNVADETVEEVILKGVIEDTVTATPEASPSAIE